MSEDERLGAIEGQVRHTIARRMKRINARWTPDGTDRMARLLAARANGELGRYAGVWTRPKSEELTQVLGNNAVDLRDQASGEDLEAWLRRAMPALGGPHASRPWVRYILRTMTSMQTDSLTA
ncbi:MAG: hypothetical protein ACM3X4_01025 [Ignavibacteriales bacterium]